MEPHQRKGPKPHPEGYTFGTVLCPGCRISETSFGKLHSSLGDGGTSHDFRALHRISSEEWIQDLLLSTSGGICL